MAEVCVLDTYAEFPENCSKACHCTDGASEEAEVLLVLSIVVATLCTKTTVKSNTVEWCSL